MADHSIVVFDIDGTVMDNTHRKHFIEKKPKNWEAFFAGIVHDTPMEATCKLVRAFHGCGYKVCWVTGRPERYRLETTQQLNAADLPLGRLYMRPETDKSPAPDYKRRVIRHEIGFENVRLVIDDDVRVLGMLALANIPCMLPACKEL